MTLDEHIKKAEQDAIQAESDSDWGFGNFFIDRTEAIAYAKECRQLVEWLKELKQIRNALGKIRAEITDMQKLYPFVDHIDTYVKEDDVLALIDKYRAESKENI